MKAYALFQQYAWLVNTIYRAGKITLEQINRRWLNTEMSGGVDIPRSTFNRHRDAILNMFGIIIECDKKDGFRYYIYNAEVLEEDSIQNWMLSTLSVNSLLSDSKEVHDRILLESIPSDGENLHKFIEAMKVSVQIKLTYKKYGSDSPSEMTVEPYLVKLIKRRWYGIVKFPGEDGWMFILAFDRILSLELTKEKFDYPKDFDPQAFFRDSYGIVWDKNIPVETIRIRAFGRQAYFFRDLPMHHSQKELESTNEYTDFEVTLRPAAEFLGMLLSRGAYIKVLEPQWLADEMKKRHEDAAKLY